MKSTRNKAFSFFLLISIIPAILAIIISSYIAYSSTKINALSHFEENNELSAYNVQMHIDNNILKLTTVLQNEEYADIFYQNTDQVSPQFISLFKLIISKQFNQYDLYKDIYVTNLFNKIIYSKDEILLGLDLDTIIEFDDSYEARDEILFSYIKESDLVAIRVPIYNPYSTSLWGYLAITVDEEFFGISKTHNESIIFSNLVFTSENEMHTFADDYIFSNIKPNGLSQNAIAEYSADHIGKALSYSTIYDDGPALVSIYGLSKTVHLLSIAHDNILISQPHQFILGVILSIILIFLICAILSYYFSEIITEPINLLYDTFIKFNKGNLGARVNYSKNNDTGYISQSANAMLDTVQSNYELADHNRKKYDILKNKYDTVANRNKVILKNTSEIIWEWNFKTKEFIVSQKWEDFFNTPAPEKITKDELSRLIEEGFLLEENLDNLISNLKNNNHYEQEITFCDGEENRIYMLLKSSLVCDNYNEPVKLIGTLTNITSTVEAKEVIKYIAYHDNLTGLLNSRMFYDIVSEYVSSDVNLFKKAAFIMLDVDHFKSINDTLGHSAGDTVIKEVAMRISSRFQNIGKVCRLGGDEFLVFVPNIEISEIELAKYVAEDLKYLLADINRDIVIGDATLNVTSSMGVAFYPNNGKDYKTLFKNADMAMYVSKDQGRNQFTFFDTPIEEKVIRKNTISECLKNAIETGEFQIYHQPIINSANHKVISIEAVPMLFSEKLGNIPIQEFIQVAAENGTYVSLATFIFENICNTIKMYREQNLGVSTITVKFSSKYLSREKSIQQFKSIIEKTGANPSWICIEIGGFMGEAFDKKLIANLQKLQNMGFNLIIDNYETGQLNLEYILNLNITALKLNSEYVANLDNEKYSNMCKQVVGLCHSFGFKAIASGIEDKAQEKRLNELDCFIMQGNYYSKPLPPLECKLLIKDMNM